jgi:hypothetical protein
MVILSPETFLWLVRRVAQVLILATRLVMA